MDFLEIESRRRDSFLKVKKTWKSIIEKYSSLGEDEQGDLIDLATGTIVEDAGHLRSIKEGRDVWATITRLGNAPPPKIKKSKLYQPLHVLQNGDGNENENILRNKSKSIAPKNNRVASGTRRNYQFPRPMTRSMVIEGDNLCVNITNDPNGHQRNNRNVYKNRVLRQRKESRGEIVPNDYDPLKLLQNNVSLDTPSRVRRLKEAIYFAMQHKTTSNRRKLKQLIWKNHRKPKHLVVID